jgi:hypothetical protein
MRSSDTAHTCMCLMQLPAGYTLMRVVATPPVVSYTHACAQSKAWTHRGYMCVPHSTHKHTPPLPTEHSPLPHSTVQYRPLQGLYGSIQPLRASKRPKMNAPFWGAPFGGHGQHRQLLLAQQQFATLVGGQGRVVGRTQVHRPLVPAAAERTCPRHHHALALRCRHNLHSNPPVCTQSFIEEERTTTGVT